MATDWMKVGVDVGTGAGLGVSSGLISDWDRKRAEAVGVTKLDIIKQAGTYFNYGMPVLSILLTAFGVVRDDWARRLITGSSVIGAMKGVEHVRQKTQEVVPWKQWNKAPPGGGGAPRAPAGVTEF